MDYAPFSNRVLTFPINSVSGAEQCTNVMINGDSIVESSGEMFFVSLTSSDADIVPGRERAIVNILDTGTLYVCVVFCLFIFKKAIKIGQLPPCISISLHVVVQTLLHFLK